MGYAPRTLLLDQAKIATELLPLPWHRALDIFNRGQAPDIRNIPAEDINADVPDLPNVKANGFEQAIIKVGYFAPTRLRLIAYSGEIRQMLMVRCPQGLDPADIPGLQEGGPLGDQLARGVDVLS